MSVDVNMIPESYELIFKEYIDELKADAAFLKHKKTGAKIALISNDDTNKVFNIGFRTPPADSTGVAHIMEHSVLCGSEHFPAKDPFVELCKGSLNTFLNAMTYPDKTIYPVASYNDTDFQNLMHVYLDAVFHPNIYIHDEIFRQEGWHYELESAEDDLIYNGVVYNEMKGAFSSPDEVLQRKITEFLYPDTVYSVESGGDPACIPDLTYENYLDFHRRYYHPSNSYIYLYGNMDMKEKLEFIDREYLSHYDHLEIDSKIREQKPFEAVTYTEDVYPIGNDEDEENAAYLSYSFVLGKSIEREQDLAFNILEYVLMEVSGAPLKQKLQDLELGEDIYGSYETSILQPYMSFVVKNMNPENKDRIVDAIRQELERIATEGLDQKILEGAINFYEFKSRESDFNRWPKGLMYGLHMLDSWLYDEMRPFVYLKYEEAFNSLRAKIGTGYFEQLIRTYLIENTHASILLLKPQKGLTEKNEAELAQKLADYKASLSDDQLKAIADQTAQLKAYQSEPSPKEVIETIPLLSIEDIEKKAAPLYNTEKKAGNVNILLHDVETNGIDYLTMIFDISSLTAEELPYVGILQEVLGELSTENYTYQEMASEINLHTGGIRTNTNQYGIVRNNTYKPVFEVGGKALAEKLPQMLNLMEEIMLKTNFDDEKRLKDVLSQSKSRMEANFMSSGHSVAVNRAIAYFNTSGWYKELTEGIAYYQFLSELLSDYENRKADLIDSLRKIVSRIFRQDNMMVDWTGSQALYEAGVKAVQEAAEHLYDHVQTEEEAAAKNIGVCPVKNEAFTTSGTVQYNALCGDYTRDGYEYNGSLMVLKNIFSMEYLWINVRVKGGAYGCMNGFGQAGSSYFVSYRDPNVDGTYKVYQGAADYVKSIELDDRELTKYIIGAIGNIDIPATPSMKGSRSLNNYMMGRNYEDIQKTRDELLGTTVESLRSLSEIVRSITNQAYVCAVGSESQLSGQAGRFEHIIQLMK